MSIGDEKRVYRAARLSEIVYERRRNPGREGDDEAPDAALNMIAASMKKHGFPPGEPLLVSVRPDGRLDLDAGSRRYRAAQIANLDTVYVIVFEANDLGEDRGFSAHRATSAIRNALENVTSPLSWWGKASVLSSLIVEHGFTEAEAAEYRGLSVSTAKNLVLVRRRLLQHVKANVLRLAWVKSLRWHDAKVLSRLDAERVPEAWNAYTKTGVVPEQRKHRGVGGRRPANSVAREEESQVKSLGEACPDIDWATLREHFPPRTQQDLVALVTWARNIKGLIQ